MEKKEENDIMFLFWKKHQLEDFYMKNYLPPTIMTIENHNF